MFEPCFPPPLAFCLTLCGVAALYMAVCYARRRSLWSQPRPRDRETAGPRERAAAAGYPERPTRAFQNPRNRPGPPPDRRLNRAPPDRPGPLELCDRAGPEESSRTDCEDLDRRRGRPPQSRLIPTQGGLKESPTTTFELSNPSCLCSSHCLVD